MDVTERFAHLVGRSDDSLPLDEASLLIAAHAQPGLDVDAWLHRLDRMAEGVVTLADWRRRLFVEVGLRGDTERYHDVDNSLLDRVLERRRGMPITLAVVGMEVARRAGLDVAGVGMPGHFLLVHRATPPVYVDAFAGGELLDAAGCRARFGAVHGPTAAWRAEYLEPATRHQIVARILANLRHSYTLVNDRSGLLWVLRLRLLLPDTPVTERRDLARVLAATGRATEAATELERLAAVAPDQADTVLRSAAELRARLN